MTQYTRLELLFGKEKIEILKNKTVAIFGLGGVGGAVVEALVRGGIQNFILIDHDVISITNINRQIIAHHQTIDQYKTFAMKERILAIQPNADVKTYECFYMPDTYQSIDLSQCDYLIDAIDTVTGKLLIIEQAKVLDIPVISSMGTGNKIDPFQFKISDIQKTSVCPLAKVMRHELKKRRIKNVKVLYSTEQPTKPNQEVMGKMKELDETLATSKKQTPGSSSFLPPIAGLMIASEVLKDLMKNN